MCFQRTYMPYQYRVMMARSIDMLKLLRYSIHSWHKHLVLSISTSWTLMATKLFTVLMREHMKRKGLSGSTQPSLSCHVVSAMVKFELRCRCNRAYYDVYATPRTPTTTSSIGSIGSIGVSSKSSSRPRCKVKHNCDRSKNLNFLLSFLYFSKISHFLTYFCLTCK